MSFIQIFHGIDHFSTCSIGSQSSQDQPTDHWDVISQQWAESLEKSIVITVATFKYLEVLLHFQPNGAGIHFRILIITHILHEALTLSIRP